VPDGSRDLPVEKALLLESGFDELNGVDWKKGCYMGQELTARTKYRGLIKRRLFPVRIEGPLPASGAPVHRDGKEVGEIRSGQGNRALAMLQIDAADGALTADGAILFPERPAWMQIPDAK
jgi:folate-binding protein YgfZ